MQNMKAFIENFLGTYGKVGIRPKMLVLLIIVLVVGFWLGRLGEPTKPETEQAAAEVETKPQFWTCSMHPQIRLPKPGLCPVCNMELIPLTSDETEMASSMRQLTVSESAKELMDIEVAPVEQKFVTATVRMVGKVDYDETKLAYITAWIPGRLDRLYVDYTGVPVNKGDHMVYLYSPELISAQEELLQAIQAVKDIQETELGIMREMTESTAEAAREKLKLWGLTSEQISEIERTGQVTDQWNSYS
jgi:Cu(I)/Ag(I) efflux system membrane fusion protein